MASNKKGYRNFVRPASPVVERDNHLRIYVSGDEAKKMYLEEVGDSVDLSNNDSMQVGLPKINKNLVKREVMSKHFDVSDKELYKAVQDNNVHMIKQVLNNTPDKINKLDEFGWSLLMIACQANSVEVAEELLRCGIDTTVRDKAGNSARSLIIKSRNLKLVDLLLNHNEKDLTNIEEKTKVKIKKKYSCEICSNIFPDKNEHLSSTLHNINASKGRKIATAYKIPQSNRGYQIMLRVGWDKDTGLGRDGAGNKYPIKTVQKKDRRGLGHEKPKLHEVEIESRIRNMNKRIIERHKRNEKRMEVNFRREFY